MANKKRPVCPYCGKPMFGDGLVFIEEGEWDGKSFEYEGDAEVMRWKCDGAEGQDGCGARIAILNDPR